MQYLNAKFPLEYVYSGAHGIIPQQAIPANPANPANPGEGNVHAPKNQGRQSTDVLVFCFFLFFFCFLFFFFVFFCFLFFFVVS